MGDYDRLLELEADAVNANGAADDQYAKTLDSLETKVNKLKNAYNEFIMGLANNKAIKFLITSLTGLINVINKITTLFGLVDSSGIISFLMKTSTLIASLVGASKGLNKLFSIKKAETFSKAISAALSGKDVRSVMEERVTLVEKLNQAADKLNQKTKKWTEIQKKGLKEYRKEKKAAEQAAQQVIEDGAERTTEPSDATQAAEIRQASAEALKNMEIEGAKEAAAIRMKGAQAEGEQEKKDAGEEVAIENTGAEVEGLQEKEDAVDEAAIELAGAKAEGKQELKDAAKEAATENAGATAEGALENAGGVTSALGGAFKNLGKSASGLAEALGVSLGTLGAIAGVLVGIATTVGVCVHLWNAFNADAKLDQAIEATERAKTAADNATDAYDNLLSARDEYNDIVSSLDSLTEGTEEWEQKILEANTQIIELLNNYKQLYQYMQVGDNGLISIDEEGWEAVVEDQKNLVEKTQAAYLIARGRESAATNNTLTAARKTNSTDNQQQWENSINDIFHEEGWVGAVGSRQIYKFSQAAEEAIRQGTDFDIEGWAEKNIGEFSYISERGQKEVIAQFVQLQGELKSNFISETNSIQSAILASVDQEVSNSGYANAISSSIVNSGEYEEMYDEAYDEYHNHTRETLLGYYKDKTGLQTDKEVADQLGIDEDELGDVTRKEWRDYLAQLDVAEQLSGKVNEVYDNVVKGDSEKVIKAIKDKTNLTDEALLERIQSVDSSITSLEDVSLEYWEQLWGDLGFDQTVLDEMTSESDLFLKSMDQESARLTKNEIEAVSEYTDEQISTLAKAYDISVDEVKSRLEKQQNLSRNSFEKANETASDTTNYIAANFEADTGNMSAEAAQQLADDCDTIMDQVGEDAADAFYQEVIETSNQIVEQFGANSEQYEQFLSTLTTLDISNSQEQLKTLQTGFQNVFNQVAEGFSFEDIQDTDEYTALLSVLKNFPATYSDATNAAEEFKNILSSGDFGVAEQLNYITQFQDQLSNNVIGNSLDDAVVAARALNSELPFDFLGDVRLEEITDQLVSDVDTIVSRAEMLQETFDGINDDLTIDASDVERLTELFPELVAQAQVLEDGTLQLNESMIDSTLEAYGIELDADAETKDAQIENQITLLEVEQEALQNGLDAFIESCSTEVGIDGAVKEAEAQLAEAEEGTEQDLDNQTTANAGDNYQNLVADSYTAYAAMAANAADSSNSTISSLLAVIKTAFSMWRSIRSGEGGETYNASSTFSGKTISSKAKEAVNKVNTARASKGLSELSAEQQAKINNIAGRYYEQMASKTMQIAELKSAQSKLRSSVDESRGTKDDSDSSSSGSDDTDDIESFENELDKLYNLVADLEELERQRNELEQEYERIIDRENTTGAAVLKIREKELLNLKKQEAYQKAILAGRKKEMETYLSQNSDLAQYATYNWDDMSVEIDYDKINKLVESGDNETYERLEDYISELETIEGNIEDAQDSIDDIGDEIDDLFDEQKEAYTDLEDKVYNAIVQTRQDEIDTMSDLSDSIDSANDKLIDSIQSSVDKIRQDRENDETEQDISDMEQRLAYLQMDTSGGNQQEILSLQEEIDDKRQDYTDSLIDQKINELEEQNDKASEERQAQIALMQAQLDYDEKNGVFWTKAHKIMSEAYDEEGKLLETSELVELLQSTDGYKGLSETSKMEWMNELEDTAAKAWAWMESGTVISAVEKQTASLTSSLTSLGETLGAKIASVGYYIASSSSSSRSGSSSGSSSGGSSSGSSSGGSSSGSSYNGTNAKYTVDEKKYQATQKNTVANGNTAWRKLPTNSLNGTGLTYDSGSNKIKQKKLSQSGIAFVNGAGTGYLSVYNQNAITKKFSKSGTKTIGTSAYITKSYSSGGVTYLMLTTSSNQNIGWVRQDNLYKRYKTGGVADFTGPAWLDGTKSKPEIVLNQSDSQNFLALKDVLADAVKGGFGSSSNTSAETSQYAIDVDINVDQIANDYDVDQMITKVKKEIAKDMKYRNVTQVSRLR